MIGRQLGPYQIVAKLGAGGMGEVYRARDTKLNREAAIKVLPELFAHDAERLARFTREAQTLASLNHPNIAQIYGVEESDGVRALVMELVDGQDLSEIIARGPVPLDDALQMARQIAEALEAAHDLGIIHRDLKPANIKVRQDGAVKVLDFGLAKAVDPAGASGTNAANSPTLTAHATQMGMVIGTAAYMSPEQARGKNVDRRADIWAFGIVLYEMLTGRRVFEGGEISDVLAAVLRQDIDWTALPPATPPRIRRLLERCLDRDARGRLRDIGEARVEIAKTLAGAADSGTSMAVPGATASAPAPTSRRLITRAVAAVVVAAALFGAWWAGRTSHVPQGTWAEFTQLTDASGVENSPSVSPDGGSFAYSSNSRGTADIYVQRVGGRNPALVAGDPARHEVWPAFSPDGKQIAFNEGGGRGGIFIVGATGESARRLTDFGANAAWSPDGTRIVFSAEEVGSVYSRNGVSPLWTVDLNGGAPVKIDDGDAIQPAWSPSGQRIAFWQTVDGQRDLASIPAAGGLRVPVTDDAAADWAPVWSPDGRYLYFASDRGGSMGIWRMGIDEASGQATGAPEPVAVGVDVSMDLPHLTADGASLIFRSMVTSVNPAAIAFDPATERAGSVTMLQRRTGILAPHDVSADGQWLALGNLRERREDLFVMRSDGTELSRVTDDAARDRFPRFTPDGALAFYSNKEGPYSGWLIRRDGGGRTRLTGPMGEVNYTAVSPDGRQLLATLMGGSWLLGAMPGPLTRETAVLIKSPVVAGNLFAPTNWSRDGRWLVGYLVTPSGGFAGNGLYSLAAGTVTRLNDVGGGELAWMPDHTRVLYITPDSDLMIQNIVTLKSRRVDVKLPLPPDGDFTIVASPDGRTIYYGAQQVEANIWKVAAPQAAKK
ncbi:MAG: PD40 domain-containing protein [Acidobacteria bacterium]|nr:PD40 domain-containing protein [Acidobacteriota bacterium]